MSPGKTRIVYILTQLELGGAQKHVLSLIEGLDPRQFETFLITSAEEGPLSVDARGLLGDRLIEIPSLKRSIQPILDLQAILQIQAILKEYRPDIVHTHSSKAGIVGRWAAWRAGIRSVIHTIHGFGFTPESSFLERRILIGAERKAASLCRRMVAVSKAVIEEGSRLNIGVRSQYQWIPYGIDREKFRDVPQDRVFELRRELKIPNHSPLVTMIACFKPQKAPLDFVRAAVAAAKQFPMTRFLMVGDGILRSQIEQERTRLGMDEKLILTGWRRDIPQILAASDVVVLTSRWEGLPIALLEAMAGGKSVVATDVGGVSEIVKNGENGFLVSPGRIEESAQAIVQLLKDPVRAKLMGNCGREGLADDYHITTMMKRIEGLYQELMTESFICPASPS